MSRQKTVETDDTKTVIGNLVKFRRWLSGRGKKYVAGQSTVDIEIVCDSLGVAIESMKHRLGHEEFKKLFHIAQCASVPLGVDGKKAMSAAKRIVRYIDKAGVK